MSQLFDLPRAPIRTPSRTVLAAVGMVALALVWKVAVVDNLPAEVAPPALALQQPADPAAPPTLGVAIHDETTVANGVVAGSLDESAARLGASPSITARVVSLFAHEFDLQRDIHTGDALRLVFDRPVTATGKTFDVGDLEYAELRGLRLYRFAPARGPVAYFDPTGRDVRGLLLRTPIEGARITSLFGLRTHPILGYSRQHQGIDFGARQGTPILAAGDGVILEAAPWGGYGNWLRLRHAGGWDTGYGHIWRYAAGVRPGTRVRQGEVIAYVGATGLATGPHLHYELWKDGQRVNPIGARVPRGAALIGADLVRFHMERTRIDGLLDRNRSLAEAAKPSRPH